MASKPRRERILAVDDAPDTLELIDRRLSACGYEVLTALSVPDAIRVLERIPVDLVITDLKMPQVSGMDLVRHVRENLRDTEVIMITGYPTIEGAVSAVKAGTQEFLTKPFTDEELQAAVRRALDVLQARRDSQPAAVEGVSTPCGLIGESGAMQRVFQAIGKAAPVRATVLISGESGTGKELVARAIHYGGPWASAPFVPVNCGSIPENLLESELFGHVRGAFTGASEARAGFFQVADGGTIFLDEVGDMAVSMQAKLLRVLQDGEVYMVGSSRPRRVDVRVVAASNKDLRALVKSELFREDLFFRLNVITIAVPPLRERDDDVWLLASHFVRKFAEQMGRRAPSFSDGALRVFRGYHWPGNVRELENLVQRLVVMTDSDIMDIPDFPAHMRFSAGRDTDVGRSLADVEAEHIRRVLAGTGGNKRRAAEILGIDRKTLREKLKSSESREG